MQTVIAILRDRNDIYTDICVKVIGDNFDDIVEKLDRDNLNKKLEEHFHDKDFDFELIGYENLETICEII